MPRAQQSNKPKQIQNDGQHENGLFSPKVNVLGMDIFLANDRVAGFGDDVPEALINLANRIRGEDTTIWVPQPARQFIEDGVVKCACPECDHIKEMSGFDEVIAYVCNECGAGVEVGPLQESDG